MTEQNVMAEEVLLDIKVADAIESRQISLNRGARTFLSAEIGGLENPPS